jgi:hypothetical protein
VKSDERRFSVVGCRAEHGRPKFWRVVVRTPSGTEFDYLQYGPSRKLAEEKAGKAVDGLNFQGWRNLPTRG